MTKQEKLKTLKEDIRRMNLGYRLKWQQLNNAEERKTYGDVDYILLTLPPYPDQYPLACVNINEAWQLREKYGWNVWLDCIA